MCVFLNMKSFSQSCAGKRNVTQRTHTQRERERERERARAREREREKENARARARDKEIGNYSIEENSMKNLAK